MRLIQSARKLWRRHRVLSIAFIAAAMLTLAFALKFLLAVQYWHNSGHRDLELKNWMTLGHVAMVYDIPVSTLAEALDLDPVDSRRMPLWKITRKRGETLEQLEDHIAETLDDHEKAEAGDDD